ncbi:unnamed protein product, partial [Brassica oleracea]
DRRTGLGSVLLDDDQKCLLGLQNDCITPSPLHAEAKGLLSAMKMVYERGSRSIRFETDCLQLLKLVQKLEEWPAMVNEVEDILIQARMFDNFSISYIPRGMNHRADCLAKAARSRVDPFVSVSVETPVWLAHVADLME